MQGMHDGIYNNVYQHHDSDHFDYPHSHSVEVYILFCLFCVANSSQLKWIEFECVHIQLYNGVGANGVATWTIFVAALVHH